MVIRQLHLGLSNLCNLKCNHCFVKNKGFSTINEERIIELINNLEEQGLTHIYYTYGEPLLYKNFFDFTRMMKEKAIFQTLLTNGTLIDESIAKKISEYGINKVMVSVDSSDEEIHDCNRGLKGSYHSAIQAIKYLKNENVNVGIATTVTKFNEDNLIDIAKLGNKLHVNSISFLMVRNEGKIETQMSSQYLSLFYNAVLLNENYVFHDKRLLKHLVNMKNLSLITDSQFEKHKSLNECMISENLSIAPDGEIYKCNFINNKPIANLNSDNIETIMKKIINNCKGCEFCV